MPLSLEDRGCGNTDLRPDQDACRAPGGRGCLCAQHWETGSKFGPALETLGLTWGAYFSSETQFPHLRTARGGACTQAVFPSLTSFASRICLCFKQRGQQDVASRVVASLGLGDSDVSCAPRLRPH